MIILGYFFLVLYKKHMLWVHIRNTSPRNKKNTRIITNYSSLTSSLDIWPILTRHVSEVIRAFALLGLLQRAKTHISCFSVQALVLVDRIFNIWTTV